VPNDAVDEQWYTVRCVFRSEAEGEGLYEERLTLWQAEDLDRAITLAEHEAARYAEANGVELLGLAQAYWLPEPPTSGSEIYALARVSDLSADDYLDRFFDTGDEQERDTGEN
jgi:hypothetical protein